MTAGRRVVIGVGNEYRRDDGIGPRVLAELARSGPPPGVDLRLGDGDAARMLDLWAGAELAVVVDALRSAGGAPGTWAEFDVAVADDLPPTGTAGTHAIEVGSTVELGRLLDRMPARLVVVAVRGVEYGFGADLSPAVEAAVARVAERVRGLVGVTAADPAPGPG